MNNPWICLPLAVCMSLAALAQEAPPAAAVVVLPGSTTRLHLDEVVHLALERSPGLKGSQAAIRASEHRVAPARALPDPALALGWAGKLTPFATMPGDASSYRGLTVSQQFPYPGKLRLQAEVAAHDVDAARADCEAARRRIVLDVTLAYAEYFYLDKAIQATRENQELLRQLASLAESQYRVGKAMQQDVLRAQVETSMLTEKLTMLEEQLGEAQAAINAALQQAPEAPLPPPEALEAPPLRYSLDELYAMAGKNDSTILRNLATIQRGQASMALAQRQYRPDIGVSYMFQQRTHQPDMNGVTVSVNLPVFWKQKQREAVAEAAESLHSAERMQEEQRNAVRAEVRRQYLAAQTAQRLLTLSSQAVVLQSSLALESAMAGYRVGKVDFSSVLASFTSVLNYETGSYRQLADYNIAVARLESLTGEPVTNVEQPAPAADQRGAR